MFNACTQTVSILYAAIFGAGDACVRIDTWSLLSAFGAFIFLVVVAQFAARRLWARMTRAAAPHQDVAETPDVPASPLGRGDTESPIKSSRF